MGGDDEDRISKLSDDLIFHIFSFMEAKYAVQTCVLSKRWENLWTTLPYLNFSNLELSFWRRLLTHIYANFVVHFLNNRNYQSHITTFEVDLRPFEAMEADSIVEYAFCHNVQQLHIFNGFLNFQVVSPVLKTLHLSHCTASLMDWELPFLETLHLDHVTIWNDESIMSLKRYINLKSLTLVVNTQRISYLEAFIIDCPNLENLTLLLFGCYLNSNCNFVISAPNLSYFKFGCRDSHLSALKVPKSAEAAFLCLKHVKLDIRINELTWNCYGLERKKQVIQKVIGVGDFKAYQPTPFRNLESLELINLMPLPNDTVVASFDYVLKYLLGNSPCAKIFIKKDCSDGKFQEYVLKEDDCVATYVVIPDKI
ncbi:hypothetical protein POM88_009052 [Heracleum sosnowskyi]|uniref:F-box domain-containing protein n=1 Tax=Heracleum sosnowskyi TaxID=360622 RepID=A0AAD8J803_9APIA|nr:hypothetical protein POM88_009052 [Heracleum sosnowskyi]